MANVDELLQHAGWLRGLARSLVADRAGADDLVQQTWVAALEHGPEGGGRAWLGRVLRNELKQRFRRERRRGEREQRVARREELPPASELAERLEMQRTLAALVAELRSPYRETVLLRFYEGLSAAEIARHKGIPGATVRSHLQRGLAELRRKLDQRHAGNRKAWSALLVPWIDPRPEGALAMGATLTTVAQGGLSMTLATKLGAALVVIALGALGYRMTQSETKITQPLSALAAEPATTKDSEPAPTPPSQSTREELAERSVIKQRAGQGIALVTESLTPLRTVATRVLDADRLPLADARLTIVALGSESRPSGSDGWARLELPPGVEGRLECEIECVGFIPRTLSFSAELHSAESEIQLGPVVLQRTGEVHGIVVDELGQGVAGAAVLLSPISPRPLDLELLRRLGPDRFDGVIMLSTNADGRFAAQGVAQEDLRIWATTREYLWSTTRWLEHRPHGVRLELERAAPDELVRGLVLDPEGRAVEGSSIRVSYRGPRLYRTRWARSDEYGRFEVLAVPTARTDLRAKDPEDRWSDAIPDERQDASEVVLRFRKTRVVPIHVYGPLEGRGGPNQTAGPIAEATVRAIARFERDTQAIGRATTSESEPGAYLLREPAEAFSLTVQAEGYADLETSRFASGELPAPYVVTLEKLAQLHGRVTVDGAGVPGARVQLARNITRVGSAFQTIHHRGFPTEWDPYADFTVRTDSDGKFSFAPQTPGDYAVRAELEGYAPAEVRFEGYDPQVGTGGLELELTGGGRIEGRVIPKSGEEALGLRVAASRGDGHVQVQYADEDGMYAFEALLPGRWMVEVVEQDLEELPTSHSSSSKRPEIPWVCEVREGSTTRYDIDRTSEQTCRLDGTLAIDGVPAAGWSAWLNTAEGFSHRTAENPRTSVGADGRLELSVAKPGRYVLRLETPEELAESEEALAVDFTLQLEPGSRSWDLELDTGKVILTGIPTNRRSGEELAIEWSGKDGARVHAWIEPRATGVSRPVRLPVGEVRVRRYRGVVWKPQSGETLLVGTVNAGDRLSWTLP